MCLEGPALTNNPLDLDLFHSTAVMDPLGTFDLITRRLSRITRLTISSVDMPPSPAPRRASATACLMVILFFSRLDLFPGAFNFSAVSFARNVPTPPPSRPTFSALSRSSTQSMHPSASMAPAGAPSFSRSAFFFVVRFLFVSLPAAASS